MGIFEMSRSDSVSEVFQKDRSVLGVVKCGVESTTNDGAGWSDRVGLGAGAMRGWREQAQAQAHD